MTQTENKPLDASVTAMQIDLSIEDDRWHTVPDLEALLERAMGGVAKNLPQHAGKELSVLLGDDTRLQDLNSMFASKHRPTNVLSFPSPIPSVANAPAAGNFLGDIAISYDRVKKEADDDGNAFTDHFSHLAIHGLLHLLGYDHETAHDASEMETLETHILGQLGIADPYDNDLQDALMTED